MEMVVNVPVVRMLEHKGVQCVLIAVPKADENLSSEIKEVVVPKGGICL